VAKIVITLAQVDSICESLLGQLISDTSTIFAKTKRPDAEKLSARDPPSAPAQVSPPKMRIEKGPERVSVPLSPRSSRPIQEMMLTTFDIGSDSSEGKVERGWVYTGVFWCIFVIENV
jgi:hypothetical protein